MSEKPNNPKPDPIEPWLEAYAERRRQELDEPIELDEDVFIDSKGIMPNEDHTLEEARLQTMKMLRFQYATTSPPKIRRYC